jgi:hypothetical protein
LLEGRRDLAEHEQGERALYDSNFTGRLCESRQGTDCVFEIPKTKYGEYEARWIPSDWSELFCRVLGLR